MAFMYFVHVMCDHEEEQQGTENHRSSFCGHFKAANMWEEKRVRWHWCSQLNLVLERPLTGTPEAADGHVICILPE